MAIEPHDLKAAVESRHGAKATLFYVAHVIGVGPTTWDRRVYVFDLEGHPTANKAYAWSFPSANDMAPQIYIAVDADGMRSAHDAVLFTIRNHRAGLDIEHEQGNARAIS